MRHDSIGCIGEIQVELESSNVSEFCFLVQKKWAAINPEKTKKKNYENSGTIYLESFKVYMLL